MSGPQTRTGQKVIAIYGPQLLDDVLGIESESLDIMRVCRICGHYVSDQAVHEFCLEAELREEVAGLESELQRCQEGHFA
jgi:hypothetical protein